MFVEETSLWIKTLPKVVVQDDRFIYNFVQLHFFFDNCVYSKELSDGSYIYMSLYMDDMLIIANNMIEIKDLKTLLETKFEIKILGAIKKILGMEIWRDQKAGLLFLCQQSYLEKVLQSFHWDPSKPIELLWQHTLNLIEIVY